MTASPSSSPDPLPMRWAVILVTAVVVSLLVGALTFMQTLSWPATLLAALGAGAMAIPALHQVLGK
jgi:hypothetical protein